MNTKIEKFVDYLNNRFPSYIFSYTKGRKYYKVWRVPAEATNQKTIYCFADIDGNLYKPASCTSPAKGIRGEIDSTIERGMSDREQYGYGYKR